MVGRGERYKEGEEEQRQIGYMSEILADFCYVMPSQERHRIGLEPFLKEQKYCSVILPAVVYSELNLCLWSTSGVELNMDKAPF